MPERREPTISSSRQESEDDPRRNSSANTEPLAQSSRQDTQKPPVRAREPSHHPVRPVVVKSKSGPFALFLALLAIGASAFLFWQSQQSQIVLQKTLADSEARIAELESKLALTGDEASASVTALQAKLKWADSEIRKLWGVSYDTNRKNITDNTTAITAANKQLKAVDGKIKNATQNVETDVKLLNELVDTQQVSLALIEQKMTAATKTMAKMTEENTAFKKRIETNEQAIEAIDAFRRTVNQQLIQLKGTATP